MTITSQSDAIDWQDISDLEDHWIRYVATVGIYHIEAWETAKTGVFAVMITISDPNGAIIAEHPGLPYANIDSWVAARLRDERRRRAQKLGQAQARTMAKTLPMFDIHPKGPRSYWLEPHAVRCGAYPGDLDASIAHERLSELLSLGVTCFVDLTESDELEPYWPLLAIMAKERGLTIQYTRHAIVDISTPTKRELRAMLDTIDYARASGQVVYVHCRGGVGRTGTVAASWLIRHGATAAQALARINQARKPMYNGWKRSPETKRQEDMVWGWRKGE
jgi:protein-tyrosine phosphatase